MKTRAQEPQGGFADDRGMTEVNLVCDDGSLLRSAHDLTGTIGEMKSCPLGYNAARSDDTGANCLQLWCLSDETWHQSECSEWGYYSVQSCDSNEVICGLRTRLDNQTPNKQSGINDIHITCCSGYP
ncbi:hypothetical protein TCAL_15642 [Tigriopus californicus]|uniref:Uncharacterized protein n=1 Tax=Tigriopus californicus TaxID=6832 RepID=A0A553PC29_TIGCA|nr:hypothetical protein TCAL_15642 [Tigriopus californicus]